MELFKKVPNLRILACGGDGTVGWVLSILDQIGAYPAPAVGVLPLGTGNDLARALGWGGGYKDEPIGKILTSIGESETTLLDRWQLKVERNPDAKNDDDGGKGKENLPLNVVNNYYSLGVDAHIALEFHEARGEGDFALKFIQKKKKKSQSIVHQATSFNIHTRTHEIHRLIKIAAIVCRGSPGEI